MAELKLRGQVQTPKNSAKHPWWVGTPPNWGAKFGGVQTAQNCAELLELQQNCAELRRTAQNCTELLGCFWLPKHRQFRVKSTGTWNQLSLYCWDTDKCSVAQGRDRQNCCRTALELRRERLFAPRNMILSQIATQALYSQVIL